MGRSRSQQPIQLLGTPILGEADPPIFEPFFGDAHRPNLRAVDEAKTFGFAEGTDAPSVPTLRHWTINPTGQGGWELDGR